MSCRECASSSTETVECEATLSSKSVLADLRIVKILVDEVEDALTTEERERAVSDLQRFVGEWCRALETLERNQPRGRQERPKDRRPKVSFWSRLFGSKRSPSSQRSVSPQHRSRNQSSQRSASPQSSPCSSAESSVSSAAGNAASSTTSQSVSAESLIAEHNATTAVPAWTDDESGELKEMPPSFRLTTCVGSKDPPSIVLKPTAVVAYDSNVIYGSYQLQMGDETRAIGDRRRKRDKDDTVCSTAPLSSHLASSSVVEMSEDDAPATRIEDRVATYENDKAFLPASGEREEVESLRSTRCGLVRRMVDFFSRFKS